MQPKSTSEVHVMQHDLMYKAVAGESQKDAKEASAFEEDAEDPRRQKQRVETADYSQKTLWKAGSRIKGAKQNHNIDIKKRKVNEEKKRVAQQSIQTEKERAAKQAKTKEECAGKCAEKEALQSEMVMCEPSHGCEGKVQLFHPLADTDGGTRNTSSKSVTKRDRKQRIMRLDAVSK